MRRFNDYPGVQAASSLITAYTVPFALVMAAFLMFRFDYSRFLLVTSYCMALLWFGALQTIFDRVRSRELFLVPGGRAGELTDAWLDRLGAARQAAADARAASAPSPPICATTIRRSGSASCATARWPRSRCSITSSWPKSLTGKLDIQHLSENTFGSVLPDMLYVKIKYVVDFVVSLLLLPFFLLLLLIVGPLIIATSPGPVFFRQERIGYGGRRFRVYKFRTMADVPATLSLVEAAASGERDKPITGIGYWLRKFRIDELPQIINVLRGQMSWIGPRPEALSAVAVVRGGAAVLSLQAHGAAGHFRLGAGQPGPCRQCRRGAGKAALRLLLHQAYLAVAGPLDRAEDDPDDPDRLRVALT